MSVVLRSNRLASRAAVPVVAAGSDHIAPSAPPNLSVASITQTTATISWDPSVDTGGSGLVGYLVYQVIAGVDTLVASPTATTVAVSSLSVGTTYTYRVRAVDGAGNQSATSSISFQTSAAADTTPPTDPGTPVVSGYTSAGFTLTWADSTDAGSGVAGYEVYLVVAGADVSQATVTAPTYNATGLTAGSYVYKVQAFDGAGNRSNKVSVTASPDTTAPTNPSPTGLAAGLITTTTVALSWNAATDSQSGVKQYDVYQGSTLIASRTTTSHTVTGLTLGTTYSFNVKPSDNAGNVGSFYGAISVTTATPADTIPPTTPTGFTSTAKTDTTVDLSWTASTDPGSPSSGVKGYNVYRVVGSVDTLITSGTPSATTKQATGLTASTSYTFKVEAVDNAGLVSSKASYTVTTLVTDTSAPTFAADAVITVTAIKPTQFHLSWPAATDDVAVTGYRVYVAKSGPDEEIDADHSSTSITVTGRSPNTKYGMRVTAHDAAGNVSTPALAAAVTTAAAGGTSWPPQDFTGGWGTTLNNRPYKDPQGNPTTEAYRWKDAADALIAAMNHPSEWNVARIQVDMGSLEPAANGVYKPSNGDVQDKVDYCVANSIRPILDLVGPHVDYTVRVKYSGCTISAVGGKARITIPNLNGNFNHTNLSVHGGGLPEGEQNYVPLGSQGSNYVDTLVPWSSTVTGKTITFGGGGPSGASSDDHMWVATGTGYNTSTFIDDGTVDHRMDIAKAAAYVAAHFAYADPIIEYWNEANGDHGRRPSANPVDRYIDELRYVYRAVKEYDPTIPVLFTGVNNNDRRSETQRSLDGPIYLRLAWARMRADARWNDGNGGGWVNDTNSLLTTSNTPTNFPGVGRYTLSGLLASGTVSPTYWVDYAGWHAYAITRSSGGSVGDDNYSYWSDRSSSFDGGIDPNDSASKNHFGQSARFVKMLNDIHTESLATGADPNIDNLRFICTETFPPWHPLAKTGVGGRVAEGFDSGGGTSNTYCASSEEAGIQIYQLKCFAKSTRAWATGGSIPAYTGPGNVEDRWAAINGQWITETPQSYAGAAGFYFQGFWTNTAIGVVPVDRLKLARGADATARQHLVDGVTHDGDSHFFSNSNFPAAVVDGVTGFDTP